MKKYITLLIAFSFLTSCSYKEDNTFEQKASNRTTSVIESYKNILEGHDGYWVLSYYPGVTRSFGGFPAAPRSLGGYTFVVKFKDGKVTASSEISNTNAEEESYYTYSITEGPTISFDTYNSILDHFRFVSAVFTNARGGDIEFIFLKEENGVITLRGRTSNNLMTLTKLTGDREALLNKLRENTQALKGKGLSPVSINGTEVKLTHFPSYRQIVFSYDGNIVQRAFTITEKGIKFYEPIEIKGVKIEELYFNEDKSALVTPDGAISTALVPCPITFTTNDRWISVAEYYASQSYIDIHSNLDYQVRHGKWRNYSLNAYFSFRRLATGNDGGTSTGITLSLRNVNPNNGRYTDYSVDYEADFVGVAGHPDQMEIFLKDPNYANGWWQYFPYLNPILEEVTSNSPYRIDATTYNQYYYLYSIKNDNSWFGLTKYRSEY
ncbi:DUF4302 domain-containing protein [Capnocytophaga gingivalis]|jgi:hypothetical protein|uniref:DUF4302 domain-containing protein n=1 Tax=Capnocytophaga gingivalis TaxID=1017 RepID=UPI002B46EEBB|nr:DUF4302 domain-containing protein [Capnocytophaga gingivalis]MEB3014559.1 DUF4302 domain-containing protein [Capnocytophaga gingivalis]